MSDKQPLSKKIIKLVIFVLLITVPVVVGIFFLGRDQKPRVTQKTVQEIYYPITADFKKEDIIGLVKKMRRDKEFEFYFYALNEDQVAAITLDVIQKLTQDKDRWAILEQIEALTEKVRNTGSLFYYLNIPEDYFADPNRYPDIRDLTNDFLTEEFKVTILGACYKIVYDKEFQYLWDTTSFSAAQKLKTVIENVKSAQN